MNRVLAIGLMILAGSTFAPCQSTFITQLDSVQAGHGGYGRSVLETADAFLVFGGQISNDGTGLTRCGVYKLGLDGAFQSTYEIGTNEAYNSAYGFFDPVERMNGGGFAATIHHFNGVDSFVELARFDGQGIEQTPITVLTCDPLDSNLIGTRQLRQTTDGGFVFCGFRDPPDSYAKAMLVKVDSTGAFQWEQDYTTAGQSYEAISVAQYVDGGYVIAGYRLPGNLVNLGFLIRTDSAGNEIWRRLFGNNDGGWGAVRVTPDGGIITLNGYRDPDWPWVWLQYQLIKRDADGAIIWESRSHYFYEASPRDLEILPDGSIITCGIYSWYAELAKFSAAGDSLWSRHLSVFNNTSDNQPSDVEPTSDGGFIITGELHQSLGDPTPGLTTIFVIKTDSLGCVVPGCQSVGVQEYVMDLQNLMRVSPNPATELVQVALDLPEGGQVQGQVQAQMLDPSGRLVLEQTVQQNLNQLRAILDVSALPAGTYYLHLRDARRWLAGSRLVVQ